MGARPFLLALLVLAIAAGIGVWLAGDAAKRAPPAGSPAGRDSATGGQRERSRADEVPTLVGPRPVDGDAQPPGPGVGRLAGLVLEAAGGAPLPGVTLVAFRPRGYGGMGFARTGEDGRFELTDLAPGPWWLVAWHPLYIPAGIQELLAAPQGAPGPSVMTIDVPPAGGTLPERVIRLASGRRIAGRVVNASGTPMPGVQLLPYGTKWRRALESRLRTSLRDWEDHLPLRTDAEGRFAFAFVPPGLKELRLGAYKSGYASSWSEAISTDPAEPPAEILFTLLETATVTGHVRLADGSPATSAEVSFYEYDARRDWCYDLPDDVPVEADGSYRLAGLPPATLDVDADWTDPHLQGPEQTVEDLQPGEVRAGVDFTLPDRYVLSLQLSDAEGEPLESELIAVRPAGDAADAEIEEMLLRTQKAGRESIALPVRGPLDVVHLRPGDERLLRAGVLLPCDELALVSESTPATRLVLRVLGPGGAPVPRFRSAVWSLAGDAEWNSRWFDSDADGRDGTAEHAVPGTAPFAVRVGQARDAEGKKLGLTTAQRRVDAVPADGVVEIRLGEAGLLRGRFVDFEDRGVAGVKMQIEQGRGEDKTVAPVPVADDGTFEFRVPRAGGALQRVRITVPPGYLAVGPFIFNPDEAEYRFVLRPAGVIGGRLVLPEGINLRGQVVAHVYWEPREGDPRHMARMLKVEVDEEGCFEVHGVPADRDLEVRFAPFALREVGLQVPPPLKGVRAGMRDLEVRLETGLVVRGTVRFAGPAPKTVMVFCVPHEREAFASMAEMQPDGRFAVHGLSPGRCRVRVYQWGSPCRVLLASKDVQAGATVAFQVGARGDIRVRLAHELDDFNVAVWRAGSTECVADADGDDSAARIVGLPADGSYDLVANSFDGVVGVHPNVRVGEEVVIDLVEAVSLGGRLTVNASTPRFQLFARGAKCHFALYVNEEGDFTGNVAPGRYDLVYVGFDGTRRVLASGVEGGREDLELTLR